MLQKNATWELMTALQQEFLEFDLEDKKNFKDKGSDTTLKAIEIAYEMCGSIERGGACDA